MVDPLRQHSEFEAIYDLRSLQGFEGELKKEVLRVIASLVANPIQPPATTGPIDPAREMYIYVQPDPHLQITYRVNNAANQLVFVHFASSAILSGTKRVVVARSHAAEAWWKKLKRFAKTIKGAVFWDISDAGAGANLTAEILHQIDAADMALLLVTQDYIVNDGVTPGLELPGLAAKCRDEKLAIQWIPVSASTWEQEEFLEKTQPLRLIKEPHKYLGDVPDGAHDAELLAITSKLRAVLQV